MLMQPMLIILTFFCDIIRVRAHNFLMPSTDDAYAVLEHAGVQKSYMNGIMNGRTDGLGFTENLHAAACTSVSNCMKLLAHLFRQSRPITQSVYMIRHTLT